MKADALGVECAGDGLIAPGFMDAVFIIYMNILNAQLLAQLNGSTARAWSQAGAAANQ